MAIDRLIFPAGVHWCHTTRSDPWVSYTLCRHVRPRVSDTPGSVLRAQQRGHRWSNPKYKGTLGPSPLYSNTVRGWPVKQTHLPLPEYGGPTPAQAEVRLVSEELSNEPTTQRAHTVIPRIGSAYKPKGYPSHPPNPLSILLVFCRINRDRCPYLGESRSMTAARSTPITRAGGRLPCRPTKSLRLPTR